MAQVRLGGLILAGGRGERFGGPKAFAVLPDGRTFLAACAGAFAGAGARPVVATVPPDGSIPTDPGVVPVPLPGTGLDMFASLVVGLDRLLAEPAWQVAVILPVDHPLVLAATIAKLAAALDGRGAAARPVHGGKHGHPIAVARPVAERIVAGELSGPTLREVLRAVETVDVPVDDPGVVANCNTPERLTAALAPR
ncbi:MAG: NTP transferase domain-containing protein [Thermoanaerobaculaceae bacterium]|nr:NTP transferase domain-containing protein [Thermoanaerobaculaceae bacterium]MDI9623135.1 NTP transferase domain-containing protein [Acidobacteriota bacterium]NLH10854.1 NTP transferase domain-containing protein [Holophagae bacterium]HPW56558.1 NTP transferase domain-containing protein [Thermoanaerobaculaceae bacterium]